MCSVEGKAWWVALPDCEAAGEVADRLRPHTSDTIPHLSGRPWLLGKWAADEVVTADAGQARVVVAGESSATTTVLCGLAKQVRDVADLNRLPARIPGSFHLLASLEGKTRIQGSVSGVRRVFHVRIDGMTVAADRADILAELAGGTLDERWLSMRMLYPPLPYSFNDSSPWREVKGVAGDCYLFTDGTSDSRVVRWWHPPDATVPLAEGAPLLRERLCAAVEVRTQAGKTISCDLSGGLDSTSLCFLVACRDAHLVTITVDGSDPRNDDWIWAKRAAEKLTAAGDVECLFFSSEEVPLMYAAVQEAGEGVDVPIADVRERARFAYIARQLLARGSRLHLGGFGGDAVFRIGAEAYLHTTARTYPRIALDHVRGHRALHRWPLRTTLARLADRRTYGVWLRAEADDLTAPPPPVYGVPRHGWGDPLRMPPWATAQAVRTARDMIVETAQDAQPLAPTRGQHETLSLVHYTGGLVRQLAGVFARAGLRLSDPYLDDRVVETCLSVRLHERSTPWQYKPLLVEALRGLVPATVLERSTKGEFSADGYAGLRYHRADLAAVCEDPIMGRLGLVDPGALRTACLDLYPPNLPLHTLDATLACEVWLRQVSRSTFLDPPVTGDRR